MADQEFHVPDGALQVPADQPWRPCPGCGVELDSSLYPRGGWLWHRVPPPGWAHLAVPPWAWVLFLNRPLDERIIPYLAGPVIVHICPVERQQLAGMQVIAEADTIAMRAAAARG